MVNNKETLQFSSAKDWRDWLKKNGEKEERVWLVIRKKDSNIPAPTYAEAVDEALCYGWIDSTANKNDDHSYSQLFAKRKPKSVWSKINKDKVKKLIAQKKMTQRGLKVIEEAKKNGSWESLDKIDRMEIPEDLRLSFNKNRKARSNFEKFPPSVKKVILQWINNAKREETRKKRVTETVKLASENKRAYFNRINNNSL